VSFDRCVNRIDRRDWQSVASFWCQVFQDYEDVGCPLTQTVDALIEYECQQFDWGGTEKEKPVSVDGIYQNVLRESIYLAHKSLVFLRGVDRDVNASQASHAEINAYTGSFMLAKAICMILGVWFSPRPILRCQWIVDLFKIKKRDFVVNAIKCPGKQIGHKELWEIFMRLLRTLENHPLDDEFRVFALSLDSGDIAKTRNHVQYRSFSWVYDDLYLNNSFGSGWVKPFDKDCYRDSSPDDLDSHFNFNFYMMLLRAYFRLFDDISKGFDSLKSEKDIFMQTIDSCKHSLFAETWID